MTRYALWQQAGSYPAQQDRNVFSSLFPIPGRLGQGWTVTATGGLGLSISPGVGVVPLGGSNGSALCISDAAETLAVGAAPGAGTTRIDLIVAQVRDSALDAGSNNDFIFQVVAGTPAASPVAPAVPARALAIQQVTVPSGLVNLAAGNLAVANSRLLWGQIAGNITLPPSTFTTVFDIPLPVGNWKIDASCQIGGTTDTAFGQFQAGLQTAAGAIAGRWSAVGSVNNPTSGERHQLLTLSFFAFITTAGTVRCNAWMGGSGGTVHNDWGSTVWSAHPVL